MDKKEWLKIEYMFARCKGTMSVVKEEICHNREEYIKKHRPIVEKFAVDNPLYIEWAKKRLEIPEVGEKVSFGLNL